MKLLLPTLVLDLSGKVWGTGELEGMGDEAVSITNKDCAASFKMDLLLPKAQPISDSGSTCGITYVRKAGKNCAAATAAQEEGENMQEE